MNKVKRTLLFTYSLLALVIKWVELDVLLRLKVVIWQEGGFFPGNRKWDASVTSYRSAADQTPFDYPTFISFSFTNETAHGLSLSENRHAHTSFSSHELSASHSFTHSRFQHHKSHLQHACGPTKINVHTFLHRKTHQITHACQSQALSKSETTNRRYLGSPKSYLYKSEMLPKSFFKNIQKLEIPLDATSGFRAGLRPWEGLWCPIPQASWWGTYCPTSAAIKDPCRLLWGMKARCHVMTVASNLIQK